MSTNPRRQKQLKKVVITYIFLLGILGLVLYILYIFIFLRKPLFISPIGKINSDSTSVEKILKRNNILFSGITLTGDYFVINIQNNGQIKLSQNKDINQQIASLQRILRELTIEGKSFKSIDFRFSQPIISF
jgi:hypothetical protein